MRSQRHFSNSLLLLLLPVTLILINVISSDPVNWPLAGSRIRVKRRSAGVQTQKEDVKQLRDAINYFSELHDTHFHLPIRAAGSDYKMPSNSLNPGNWTPHLNSSKLAYFLLRNHTLNQTNESLHAPADAPADASMSEPSSAGDENEPDDYPTGASSGASSGSYRPAQKRRQGLATDMADGKAECLSEFPAGGQPRRRSEKKMSPNFVWLSVQFVFAGGVIVGHALLALASLMTLLLGRGLCSAPVDTAAWLHAVRLHSLQLHTGLIGLTLAICWLLIDAVWRQALPVADFAVSPDNQTASNCTSTAEPVARATVLASDVVELWIWQGWRSPLHQQHSFRLCGLLQALHDALVSVYWLLIADLLFCLRSRECKLSLVATSRLVTVSLHLFPWAMVLLSQLLGVFLIRSESQNDRTNATSAGDLAKVRDVAKSAKIEVNGEEIASTDCLIHRGPLRPAEALYGTANWISPPLCACFLAILMFRLASLNGRATRRHRQTSSAPALAGHRLPEVVEASQSLISGLERQLYCQSDGPSSPWRRVRQDDSIEEADANRQSGGWELLSSRPQGRKDRADGSVRCLGRKAAVSFLLAPFRISKCGLTIVFGLLAFLAALPGLLQLAFCSFALLASSDNVDKLGLSRIASDLKQPTSEQLVSVDFASTTDRVIVQVTGFANALLYAQYTVNFLCLLPIPLVFLVKCFRTAQPILLESASMLPTCLREEDDEKEASGDSQHGPQEGSQHTNRAEMSVWNRQFIVPSSAASAVLSLLTYPRDNEKPTVTSAASGGHLVQFAEPMRLSSHADAGLLAPSQLTSVNMSASSLLEFNQSSPTAALPLLACGAFTICPSVSGAPSTVVHIVDHVCQLAADVETTEALTDLPIQTASSDDSGVASSLGCETVMATGKASPMPANSGLLFGTLLAEPGLLPHAPQFNPTSALTLLSIGPTGSFQPLHTPVSSLPRPVTFINRMERPSTQKLMLSQTHAFQAVSLPPDESEDSETINLAPRLMTTILGGELDASCQYSPVLAECPYSAQ